MYDDTWTIEEAQQAIKQGHRLYTISRSTGDAAELEVFGPGIRIKPNERADADLEVLPECG